MTEPITFLASVVRVKTLVDGGIRVELDLPETAIMTAAQLMECKRVGAALNVVMQISTELNGETKKGPEGSGIEVGRRRLGKR